MATTVLPQWQTKLCQFEEIMALRLKEPDVSILEADD